MCAHAILLEWQAAFGAALPAGFLCRQALPDRWMRIHSLPESKRYPEDADEYSEMLKRQNAVASDTLGDGSECVLFMLRFGKETELSSDDIQISGTTPAHVMSVRDEEEGIDYQFFGTRVSWQRERFNELLVACADDRTGPILFANVSARRIYAPYDGGADLFLASPQEVAEARGRFAKWLSARCDGL